MTETQNPAPERIWLEYYSDEHFLHLTEFPCVSPYIHEYIREDVHERIVAEAVAAAVQTVLDDVGYTYEQLGEDARAALQKDQRDDQ